MSKEKLLNVPNVLSAYRLLTFPLLLVFIYYKQGNWFAILLCINLVTDILDGVIARAFNLQTEFGARLDSIADFGTYIAGVGGIYAFKADQLGPLLWMLWLFIFLILLYSLVSLIRFRKLPSLHLYSTKIGGYLQGIFFFVLFAFDYYPWLYFLAVSWGYLSALEELIILLIIPRMQSNARGLYWVMKKLKNEEE